MKDGLTDRRAGSSASPSHIPVPPAMARGVCVSRAEDSPTTRPAAVRPSREGDPADERARPPRVRDGLFWRQQKEKRNAHRYGEEDV